MILKLFLSALLFCGKYYIIIQTQFKYSIIIYNNNIIKIKVIINNYFLI